MAEFYISFKDIEMVVDQYISQSIDKENLSGHRAEIMAALTGDFEQNNLSAISDMVSLWENQIEQPSQLLLGSRYIRIQQIMLEFLKVALTSGLIDAVIVHVSQGDFSGFTISVGSALAVTLWELFDSVKKLDDWDFCIYMQAVTHFRHHKEFTEKDLKEWFPQRGQGICNMHNSTWECDYLQMNDVCAIVKEEKLTEALESLCNKGLLSRRKENHKYIFKFKR